MGTKSRGFKSWSWDQLAGLSDKEMRAAYTELRDIATKRIKRGGGLPGSGLPGHGGMLFPKLRDLKPDQVAGELKKLHVFVRNPWTKKSVSKKREKEAQKVEKARKTLEANGYNIDNMDRFGRFMESMRLKMQTRGKRYRTSDQWAVLFEQAERLQISQEDLDKHYKAYLNNLDKLEAAPAKKNGQGYTHGQLRRLMYGKKK